MIAERIKEKTFGFGFETKSFMYMVCIAWLQAMQVHTDFEKNLDMPNL